MQKYIAVVNHRMDDDEISSLIAQDIAGCLFSIAHQNYSLAGKLIQQVRELSLKHNRPVSIIQDVSGMTDPLDLEFGIRSGVHWVVVSDPAHGDTSRKIDKTVPVIWKGEKEPKNFKPDAMLNKNLEIQHFDFIHPQHKLLHTVLKIADHAHVDKVLVSDIKVAKALSAMKPNQKIVYLPKDKNKAGRGALYPHVHPIFHEKDLAKTGERVLDLRDGKHVKINFIE